jgi:hypothetical protein
MVKKFGIHPEQGKCTLTKRIGEKKKNEVKRTKIWMQIPFYD